LMLGAVGSAYALIFSNIVAFLLTFVAIIIEFCKKHIVPTINYSLLKRILALALPIAILNVVATISFMSLTRFATIFAGGSVAILSAHLLAIRYNSMVVLPSRSLASGVTAVTARNLGDRDRLQDIAKYGLIYGVVFGGIMAVVTLLFSKQLIAIFGGHEVDSLIGATYLKILSIDCLVVPIVVVLFALVDGAHHTTSTMIISLLSSISRPITAYVAGAVLGLNIYGVAIAVPTASLISLAIIVPILLFIKIKDSKKKIAENSVSAIQT
ncbi:MAG: MATE family efflux transporter, partial [Bacillota bacterium]